MALILQGELLQRYSMHKALDDRVEEACIAHVRHAKGCSLSETVLAFK
jgi:hypothetical protein